MRTSLLAVASVVVLTGCAGTEPTTGSAGPTATPSPVPTAVPTLSPSPSATSAAPTPPADGRTLITLSYAAGKVSGDTGRVRVPLGATVLLRVTSDVADEVHVHGVDEYVDLVPGRQVAREFVADTAGVFELELHDAGTLLTRMQVQ